MIIAVGLPSPFAPVPQGMVAIMVPGPEKYPELTLIASLDGPAWPEAETFSSGPFSVGVVPLSPVALIWLNFEEIFFDAPYSPAVEKDPEALVTAIQYAATDLPDGIGLRTTLVLVDSNTNVVHGLRVISLGRSFWTAISDSVGTRTSLDRAEYSAAAAQAQQYNVNDLRGFSTAVVDFEGVAQ